MAEHGHRLHTRAVTILLAALSALGPFSIDAYLPSFHEIAAKLNATPIEVQQTLSAYLFAFAAMTLWHGAISDHFGRRKVIFVALGLFSAASIGCALATSIGQLWFWRAMQGVTAGAGIVVSRAIVRDLFDGAAAQRLMAHITMMFALAPAIAPLIGGQFQRWLGWRSVFGFLAGLTVILGLACWKLLPETLPPEKRQPFNHRYLLATYRKVLSTPSFLFACGGLATNFCGFFVYVLSAPVFLMQHLGLPETAFLWLFGPSMCGLMSGSWVTGRLAGRRTPEAAVTYGYVVMGSAALLNVAINLTLPPAVPWSVIPIFVYTFGMAMTTPSLTLFALDPFPAQRGLAASCQTFLQAGFNGIVAAAIAPLVWGSTLSLALTMASFVSLGALSSYWQRRSARQPG